MTETAVPVAEKPKKVDETDIIKVRFTHLFRDFDTSSRRGMFSHGDNHAITVKLSEDDVKLLAACGVEPQSFEPHQYTFQFEKQPSVEVLEKDKGVYTLYSVLNLQGSYVTSEGLKKMTQDKIEQKQKQIQQAKQEMTLEILNGNVQTLIDRYKKEAVEDRDKANIVLSPEILAIEDAQVFTRVVGHIDNTIANFGMLEMATLWLFRQSGKYRELKAENVADAIRDLPLKEHDYAVSLALVVDRIFPDVEAAVKSGHPFVNPEKENRAITVEWLITQPGLVKKLTKSSDHYAKLLDRDSKQALLAKILNGTVKEVEALREGQAKVTEHEPLQFKVIPIDGTKRSKIEMEVDEIDLATVIKLLKPLGVVSQ